MLFKRILKKMSLVKSCSRTITFFSSKPYVKQSFNALNEKVNEKFRKDYSFLQQYYSGSKLLIDSKGKIASEQVLY